MDPPPPIIMSYFHVMREVISLHYFGQNGFPRHPMHPKNEYLDFSKKKWVYLVLKTKCTFQLEPSLYYKSLIPILKDFIFDMHISFSPFVFVIYFFV